MLMSWKSDVKLHETISMKWSYTWLASIRLANLFESWNALLYVMKRIIWHARLRGQQCWACGAGGTNQNIIFRCRSARRLTMGSKILASGTRGGMRGCWSKSSKPTDFRNPVCKIILQVAVLVEGVNVMHRHPKIPPRPLVKSGLDCQWFPTRPITQPGIDVAFRFWLSRLANVDNSFNVASAHANIFVCLCAFLRNCELRSLRLDAELRSFILAAILVGPSASLPLECNVINISLYII